MSSPQRIIVSLTSFPQAIPYALKAINSILNGSVLPDKLILYLTFSQFVETAIPEELTTLAETQPIFEIRNYDDDIRSYRKLIPALIEFPNDIIITIDDDVAYHRDLLKQLLQMHAVYPQAVLAHRAKLIDPEKAYRKWRKYRWYHFLFKKIHVSNLNLPTGVAGVLYPPHCLKADMLNPELFKKIAPTTDDIWFWAAAVANNTPIIPVPFGKNKPKGVGKPKQFSLKTINFKTGIDRNAEALKAIVEAFPEVGKRIHYKTCWRN